MSKGQRIIAALVTAGLCSTVGLAGDWGFSFGFGSSRCGPVGARAAGFGGSFGYFGGYDGFYGRPIVSRRVVVNDCGPRISRFAGGLVPRGGLSAYSRAPIFRTQFYRHQYRDVAPVRRYYRSYPGFYGRSIGIQRGVFPRGRAGFGYFRCR